MVSSATWGTIIITIKALRVLVNNGLWVVVWGPRVIILVKIEVL